MEFISSYFILSFACVNIVNRERKNCQYCLIIKKTNGDIAVDK